MVNTDENTFHLELQVDHNETLAILNTHRRSKLLCDVVLVVDGEEFPAHRGVLAANSQFFLALFTTEMLEKDKGRTKLSNVGVEELDSILEFMYTGQIQINSDNVFQLLEVSDFLLVVKVREACCQFLESVLDVENCLTFLSIADMFSCDRLSFAARQFIHRQFVAVSKTESFMNLHESVFKELLSSDDLQIEDEEQVLGILIDWIKFDLEARKFSLTRLLPYIRLPFNQPPLLESQLRLEELSRSKCFTREITGTEKPSCQLNARKSYRTVKVILVAGGCDHSAILNTTSCFIPSVKKWAELSNMTIPRWRLQLLQSEGSLYAIGGLRDVCTKDLAIPFIERFDGRSSSWKAIRHRPAISNVEIDSFCAVLFGGKVLLSGGLGPHSNRCTSRVISVELRDGSSSVEERASMTLPRAGHGMVTSLDHVYVIGGFQDNQEGTHSVERYDAAKDTWTSVQPMNERRHFAAAVFMENKIYVIGGVNRQGVLSSCEVYDIKSDTWQPIPAMQSSRMRHSAVVHDGSIYVFGGLGENQEGAALKSVECYVPGKDRWEFVCDMQTGRFDHQCSVVDVGYKFVASAMET